MFTHERLKEGIVPYGSVYAVMYNGTVICYYASWAFGSCAAAELTFKGAYDTFNSPEKVEEFIKWLASSPFKGSYANSYEAYFLINGIQKDSTCKHLINSEHVKFLDSYLNRAHGPSTVYLYRLSVTTK